jgi:hypothetical protein
VISEIAVAVMLVVACGLLLRSFWTMQDVDAGFRADGLTTFQIYLPESTYPDPASEVGFLRDLSARLREIPGVESATAMTGLPPRRRLNANDMDFEGVPETEEGPPHNVRAGRSSPRTTDRRPSRSSTRPWRERSGRGRAPWGGGFGPVETVCRGSRSWESRAT